MGAIDAEFDAIILGWMSILPKLREIANVEQVHRLRHFAQLLLHYGYLWNRTSVVCRWTRRICFSFTGASLLAPLCSSDSTNEHKRSMLPNKSSTVQLICLMQMYHLWSLPVMVWWDPLEEHSRSGWIDARVYPVCPGSQCSGEGHGPVHVLHCPVAILHVVPPAFTRAQVLYPLVNSWKQCERGGVACHVLLAGSRG